MRTFIYVLRGSARTSDVNVWTRQLGRTVHTRITQLLRYQTAPLFPGRKWDKWHDWIRFRLWSRAFLT